MFDAQTYALLYCKYDSASGNRRYDLLSSSSIAQLDIEIARTAVTDKPLSEVLQIIYYGSPNAQKMSDSSNRNQYVSSIIRRLNP